jgi:hypothetical protein
MLAHRRLSEFEAAGKSAEEVYIPLIGIGWVAISNLSCKVMGY